MKSKMAEPIWIETCEDCRNYKNLVKIVIVFCRNIDLYCGEKKRGACIDRENLGQLFLTTLYLRTNTDRVCLTSFSF